MRIEIVGRIERPETIASGKGIREIERLRDTYGPGRWRREFKVKRILGDRP